MSNKVTKISYTTCLLLILTTAQACTKQEGACRDFTQNCRLPSEHACIACEPEYEVQGGICVKEAIDFREIPYSQYESERDLVETVIEYFDEPKLSKKGLLLLYTSLSLYRMIFVTQSGFLQVTVHQNGSILQSKQFSINENEQFTFFPTDPNFNILKAQIEKQIQDKNCQIIDSFVMRQQDNLTYRVFLFFPATGLQQIILSVESICGQIFFKSPFPDLKLSGIEFTEIEELPPKIKSAIHLYLAEISYSLPNDHNLSEQEHIYYGKNSTASLYELLLIDSLPTTPEYHWVTFIVWSKECYFEMSMFSYLKYKESDTKTYSVASVANWEVMEVMGMLQIQRPHDFFAINTLEYYQVIELNGSRCYNFYYHYKEEHQDLLALIFRMQVKGRQGIMIGNVKFWLMNYYPQVEQAMSRYFGSTVPERQDYIEGTLYIYYSNSAFAVKLSDPSSIIHFDTMSEVGRQYLLDKYQTDYHLEHIVILNDTYLLSYSNRLYQGSVVNLTMRNEPQPAVLSQQRVSANLLDLHSQFISQYLKLKLYEGAQDYSIIKTDLDEEMQVLEVADSVGLIYYYGLKGKGIERIEPQRAEIRIPTNGRIKVIIQAYMSNLFLIYDVTILRAEKFTEHISRYHVQFTTSHKGILIDNMYVDFTNNQISPVYALSSSTFPNLISNNLLLSSPARPSSATQARVDAILGEVTVVMERKNYFTGDLYLHCRHASMGTLTLLMQGESIKEILFDDQGYFSSYSSKQPLASAIEQILFPILTLEGYQHSYSRIKDTATTKQVQLFYSSQWKIAKLNTLVLRKGGKGSAVVMFEFETFSNGMSEERESVSEKREEMIGKMMGRKQLMTCWELLLRVYGFYFGTRYRVVNLVQENESDAITYKLIIVKDEKLPESTFWIAIMSYLMATESPSITSLTIASETTLDAEISRSEVAGCQRETLLGKCISCHPRYSYVAEHGICIKLIRGCEIQKGAKCLACQAGYILANYSICK